jgi:chemotaxis protein MotB
MSEKAKVIIITKKAKGHGHHGGAWKVAYADFVTAMMALFMVLWLVTQTDVASKEELAQYFRTGKLPGGSLVFGNTSGSNPPMAVDLFPEGAASTGGSPKKDLSSLAKSVRDVISRAKKDPTLAKIAKNVAVKFGDKGAVIELVDGGDDLLFALASDELRGPAITFLQALAPEFAKGAFEIEIHGHTDARPYGRGSQRSNWNLSFERADSARRILEAAGVPGGKIQAVTGHADAVLYNRADPMAAENRRLSIMIVPPRAGVSDVKDAAPDTRLFEPDKLNELPVNTPSPAKTDAVPAAPASSADPGAPKRKVKTK